MEKQASKSSQPQGTQEGNLHLKVVLIPSEGAGLPQPTLVSQPRVDQPELNSGPAALALLQKESQVQTMEAKAQEPIGLENGGKQLRMWPSADNVCSSSHAEIGRRTCNSV